MLSFAGAGSILHQSPYLPEFDVRFGKDEEIAILKRCNGDIVA
jgi:phosphoribosylamine-glycine ligase